MKEVIIGKKVPAFKLPATGNKDIKSPDPKSKNIGLYFYPKGSTPACTHLWSNKDEKYVWQKSAWY